MLTTSAFDRPGRLAAKADPAVIAADERHFAAIAWPPSSPACPTGSTSCAEPRAAAARRR